MAHKDHQTLFLSLGFLAAILNEIPQGERARRAIIIGRLIESFCITELPGAFSHDQQPSDETTDTEKLLELYLADLTANESASLRFDRQTLLAFYELLIIREIREKQTAFYETASDDMIANAVLQKATDKITRAGHK